jgi:hypothetical protein
MNVVDAIAALPTPSELNMNSPVFGGTQGTALNDAPVRNYTANDLPAIPAANQLVVVSNFVVDPTIQGALGGDSQLTFSVLSNSNPNLVTPAIDANRRLMLDFSNTLTGSATITIRATDPQGETVDESFTVTVGQALSLPGSQVTEVPNFGDLQSLPTQSLTPEMRAVVTEAVARFAAAGVGGELLQRLQNANVLMADLPGGLLGLAGNDTVWLDADAGGYGWFLDATPADDLEFALNADGVLQAISPDAAGVDLLSAAAHELGHLLGLPDLHADAPSHGLMSESLPTGLRRDLVDALMQVDQ